LYRLNEQKRAIQPTKRSNSSDKSRRFSRQTAAIQPTKRSGSTDEKGISTKTQLQTITMQFPYHVGEGQGWGQ